MEASEILWKRAQESQVNTTSQPYECKAASSLAACPAWTNQLVPSRLTLIIIRYVNTRQPASSRVSWLNYYFFVIAASCQTCSTCLHIPLSVQSCLSWYLILQHTVMNILLYFIFYILFFISYFLFILFYAYFTCVVFYNICTVHGADLTHISLLVIQSLYSHVCDK